VKLKRIELQGFKSFVDRTVLHIDEGITAVLGPNGCGKSNVVDAVRWVLGEQSAKTLRGDRMDDVIFKGTTKRKPVGMAEVTITFSNDDGRLPIDFDEVAIKRRVTRDNVSEYFLNGSLCRLKDIRDLLWDSGVNNASYSIIEESMIKQILNENHTELRNLLEEGSGITKYKARRKETQRKLDRTSQDLLRLNDIIEEIDREVRSLQRQVGKARRHQRLFREIRALDLLLAARRREQLDRREAEIKDRVQELSTLAESDTGELGGLRASIEAQKPLIDEREAERRQLEDALQAFEEELQEHERQVVVLEQRIVELRRRADEAVNGAQESGVQQGEVGQRIAGMEQRLAEVEVQIDAARGDLAGRSEELQLMEQSLASDRSSLEEAAQLNLEVIETDAAFRSQVREFQVKRENRQERLSLLDGERAQLLHDAKTATAEVSLRAAERDQLTGRRRDLLHNMASTERRITELEVRGQELQSELAAATGRRESTAGRLEMLRSLAEGFAGYGEGAKHVLTAHGARPEVRGGLGDQLVVPEAWTVALEVLCGEIVDAVVVDGAGTAASLSSELREGKRGLATFLCDPGDAAATTGDLPPGATSALSVVSGPATGLPYLRRLLARTVLCDGDDAALAGAHTARGAESPLVFLSATGLLVTSDGLVRGGAGERGEVSLLGRGDKVDKLADEVASLERKVSAAVTTLAANQADRESSRILLNQGREDLSSLDADLQGTQVALAQLEDRRESALKRRDELTGEGERLTVAIAELQEQECALQESLVESTRQRADTTIKRDDLRRRVQDAESRRDEVRYDVEQMRLIQQRREGERREVETTLSHLRQNVTELQGRRERLEQDAAHCRDEALGLEVDLKDRREALATQFQERERRRQILRASAAAIAELHQQTAAWHDRVKAIEDKRTGCREQIHQLETELATLDLRRNNLEERVEEQYSGNFAELIAAIDPEHLPRELEVDEGVFQHEQAEQLLTDKRQQITALGPINHLALEEYETKKERLDFLTAQREDVVKAKTDLEKAIGEINRTARKLFSDTFEEVRRNYIAVFRTLFRGGRADLILLKTDDPLESDIQILAQPTGKVIDHVSLLSGGERCLTALSILFAVYLVKPSPFCLLDEADAPLDDTNIGRFVNMLREFSKHTQFLVITHNKLTMETANHLYGVTMMERGVSSIVSVTFKDVAASQSDTELAGAIASRRQDVDSEENRRAAAAAAGSELDFNGTNGAVMAAAAADELAAAEAAMDEDDPDEFAMEAEPEDFTDDDDTESTASQESGEVNT
jgi:chromosome segregation protein